MGASGKFRVQGRIDQKTRKCLSPDRFGYLELVWELNFQPDEEAA